MNIFPWNSTLGKERSANTCPPEAAAEILVVYDWILKHHHTIIDLAGQPPEESDPYPELTDERGHFQTSLLSADYAGALKIAESILDRENGQEMLYMELIKPVMYEIGRLWENDRISTAEEHLATSIVGRLFAALYEKIPFPSPHRGKAIVTSAPNEFHELGARLLADLLESDGWNVLFLGANTPARAIIDFIGKIRPRFIAISLTMPFSLDRISEIIASIRDNPDLNSVKILVGGAAFNAAPHLWKVIGADAWADTPRNAIYQVRQW